ncbi:high affinity cGMP-specific 3',5'-cyclic phosphodiesterase 9A isoform X1 [Anguilla rostrata]|uniref:high affinity cGMP-specific 3',5'-cyclic phosphodiesterase 9A isoform X2 n=1 Tax=Anguilla anguilla TaxID=7936 RepID=UPI0015A80B4C|nr:high affinity cGMP-specific 3',5'-cyclic phosphodiesterase 9A isoform X2 [Anguilla anguilla]
MFWSFEVVLSVGRGKRRLTTALVKMATKIIYFTVNGRPEQAEFPVDCPAQDVKDLFRAAAEAGPHDILKLYNTKGSIINISPQLEPNSPHACYKLEVVATDCNRKPLGGELAVALGFDLSSMEKSSLEVTEEVRQYLKTPTFDNWQWEDTEIMVLLQVMYTDLDFISTFNIEVEVLQQFLYEVYRRYNNIPFHNFKHCFCVTQMMYGLIWLTDLRTKMESIDLLIMLTSAVCHDLDHTGYNNAYQINARTELALRYNDISPLENHHCAVAFEILEKKESNIFRNLTTEQYKRIREGMIKCILATDMTRHNEILNKFKSILPSFDFSNKDHKDVLMMIMIKVSDISNEARPMDVAEPWLDCLLQEFFNQSDMEKLEGLPVTPFMDRDKVTKPSSQTGFIRFVLFPLFIELANLFPCLEQHIIDPVRKALDYYTEMEKALDKEKQT